MMKPLKIITAFFLLALSAHSAPVPSFRVLVLASRASDHVKMIAAARPYLEKMAADNNFSLDFTDDTSKINDANLAGYQVFVMLHLAPFDMSYSQQAALQRFVEQGKGWVGIHAAGLTGKEFLAPHSRYWQWFEEFMGGVIYSPHPAYQQATLIVEDRNHPATKGLPARFAISDEWYEFNTSPRSHVRVLASVDESSYRQNKPMGDHPIIWTNERYRRMIYIGVGHDPSVFNNDSYTSLLRNAILWAASISIPMKDRIVNYEKEYPFVKPMPKEARVYQAAQRLGGATSRTISIPVSTHNSYKLKFDIAITVGDSGYRFRAWNFYEKSTEKGISHEYSKIEYRWWDFRQGHPWSSEDRTLFTRLDSTMRALMDSFAAAHPAMPVDPADADTHPRFRALVLYENGGHHIGYSRRARVWLDQLAADSNFVIDYLTHTDSINAAFLSNYQLIIQLDFVPYAWKPEAMMAFQQYIEEGRGGWVGFHHATLLGEFDGYSMWPWFYSFMGSIRWKDYIARFAKATVRIEDHSHPVFQGIPDSFVVQKEEWYTYDKSPRPNVHVLAHVDESTYQPDTAVKMGDHPVIWTNEHVRARNVYIFMGHDPILFDDPVYRRLFSNSIFWAAATPRSSAPAHALTAAPSFHALAFFSTTVEEDHVDFAWDAIRFYTKLAAEKGFVFDTTTNWENCSDRLKNYQVVLWLNDFPHTEEQRNAFRQYMETGGAWLGFHVAGYNDKDTRWPWFVDFLGGAVFYNNNWPPLPAQMIVNDTRHPATRQLPSHYKAPINEWYGWQPNPRLNKDVRILITLDPANYPLGKKDIIRSGDIPVVWTNTRYKMLYMNMGHGDQNLSSPLQNTLFKNALLWLGTSASSSGRLTSINPAK